MTKPWWSHKWGKDKRCVITQSRLRPGKDNKNVPYVIDLSCSHRFYRSALEKWWREKGKQECPLCRKLVFDSKKDDSENDN